VVPLYVFFGYFPGLGTSSLPSVVEICLDATLSLCAGGGRSNVLQINTDNTVQWDGFIEADSGLYQNAATVTGVLYDRTGTAVPGSAFTLPYVAGSNGSYRGLIPNAVAKNLKRYATYELSVIGVIAGGYQLEKRLALPAAFAP
jgi:hypothetical protein